MPGLGVMRAEIIPPGVQSTVMNLYRVPLNAVVVTGTKLGASYGWEAVGDMQFKLILTEYYEAVFRAAAQFAGQRRSG